MFSSCGDSFDTQSATVCFVQTALCRNPLSFGQLLFQCKNFFTLITILNFSQLEQLVDVLDHGFSGGNELLFILPRTMPDDATRALERLREELVLAQSVSGDPTITMSIGVIGSTTGGTIEALLHRAAGALNHAKSQGGNRVVVAQPAPKAS